MSDRTSEYESILLSTKKALGIEESYTHFDPELIMHINSVFSTLHQLKVGPAEPYAISSDDDTWDDFVEGRLDISSVKTYMYLRVKLLFDPPSNATVLDSFQKQLDEIAWRLNVAVDSDEEGDE